MKITVCIGSSCHLKGSREVVETFNRIIQEKDLSQKVELNGTFCLGSCRDGVCLEMNGQIYSVTPATAEDFLITRF